MINSIILESNKISELLITSFFNNARIDVTASYCERVDSKKIFEIVDYSAPSCIVIEYELYCDNIYDIISNIRQIVPECVIIIVSNKIKKSVKKQLINATVDEVFIKPIIDTHFYRAIRMLVYN